MPRHWQSHQQELADLLVATRAIVSPHIEAAFRTVPRHIFVPHVELVEAYANRVVPLKYSDTGDAHSTLSQPTMIAIMLDQLALEPGQRVLEIGAGSGYNAALMAHIVGEKGQVVTLELDQDLADAAQQHLADSGFEDVRVVCGDGAAGYALLAPYDCIILTASAADIAPAWIDQLTDDGRLVLPLELAGGLQQSTAFQWIGDHLQSISTHYCRFVPLRGQLVAAIPAWQLVAPGLYIDNSAIDPAQIYDWLAGDSLRWTTGVAITPREYVEYGLDLWMNLHLPNWSTLVGEADQVDHTLMPFFLSYSRQPRSLTTYLLPTSNGLAVLERQPAKVAEMPTEIMVRSYGDVEDAVEQVIRVIRGWDARGRRPPDAMQIRAYPAGAVFPVEPDEIVLKKTWTQLVIHW